MIEFKPVADLMGPWGHWSVGDKIFYVKREALEYASSIPGAPVVYKYFNSVWENFDRKKLGKMALNELYRMRAQQIRDRYDWVTLNYSGGSDSHNILVSFLKNNIKLDLVYVNWPMKTVNNKKVYTANTQDRSASNILSEWDYAIEPTLKWLAANRPEVQVEIGDWSENLDEKQYNEDNFLAASTYWGAGSLFRNLNESKITRQKVDQGLRVADVFGFDKPHLYLHPDDVTVSMFFHDAAFQTATNATGTFEPFYWSPDFPELAFEMAYSNFQYYNAHPEERKYIRSSPMRVSREVTNEFNNDLCRKLCYTDSWNLNTFQAGKPYAGTRTDRDFWIYELEDFRRLVDAWRYNHSGFLSKIAPKFFDEKGGLHPIRSQLFYLGKFNAAHNESVILI